MTPFDLFHPPVPLHDDSRVLEGEISMDVQPHLPRRYRWKLHLDRVNRDWREHVDTSSRMHQPPGWAFGLTYLDPEGIWRPVRHHERTWMGWRIVRDLPEVRDALGGQLMGPTNATTSNPKEM